MACMFLISFTDFGVEITTSGGMVDACRGLGDLEDHSSVVLLMLLGGLLSLFPRFEPIRRLLFGLTVGFREKKR